jgi:hypothetical protein
MAKLPVQVVREYRSSRFIIPLILKVSTGRFDPRAVLDFFEKKNLLSLLGCELLFVRYIA